MRTVAGGALVGVRWYEIRNPANATSVYQEGTIVDPAVDYWLGSVAMDKVGNMSVGFSASGKALAPSIYAAGRALGTLSGPMGGLQQHGDRSDG